MKNSHSSHKARRTKILVTLGPASADEDTVRRMIEAGVDVFRLNFSHGTRDEHRRTISSVRGLSHKTGTEVAILQDLCGPKIRVGTFRDGCAELRSGQETTITTRRVEGDDGCFSTNYEALPHDVARGARVLLDDGALEMEVLSVSDDAVHCRVVRGGRLHNRKGMNLPGTVLSAPSVTRKDLEDLAVGIEAGIDFVALSFVRHPDDLASVREVLDRHGCPAQIIAKIEKPEAIEHIEGIIDSAHGILVARGDLGVEMDLASVSLLQKDLVRRANEQDKYVIVATQMLESMIGSPVPTRAEVSDVTNAILDGADALMLSGETAVGAFPVESVRTMDSIARTTEDFIARHRPSWDWRRLNRVNPVQDAIGHAAFELCAELKARSVAAFSATGGTALFLSKNRPQAPILAFTANREAARRMRLFWGVIPVLDARIDSRDSLLAAASRYLTAEGMIEKGDTLLLVAGTHFGQVKSTNVIEVVTV